MTMALQGVVPDTVLDLDSTIARIGQFDWRALIQWQVVLPYLIRIAVIILIGTALYRLVKLVIRRLVEREIEAEDPVVKRLREQRAQTLGSLLGNVALIVIVTITFLMVLGSFMDIGPLLASVGVLGLAVSFGAQSLVKDVISGTFMLLEGQFGIGDVVRVTDVSGQVEKITLRTTVLRDAQGVVHIIPNGEITRVSNLTKTWSRAVLDIGVAYKEDVDRVIRVLDDIGRELHADPEWGALLIDEPLVLGVENLADSAVVLRVSARTLPQKQWDLAREWRRRIKNRFDQENIEIPYPHMTFYWGEGQTPPGGTDAPGLEHYSGIEGAARRQP